VYTCLTRARAGFVSYETKVFLYIYVKRAPDIWLKSCGYVWVIKALYKLEKSCVYMSHARIPGSRRICRALLTFTGLFWHIYRALLTYTQKCCVYCTYTRLTSYMQGSFDIYRALLTYLQGSFDIHHAILTYAGLFWHIYRALLTYTRLFWRMQGSFDIFTGLFWHIHNAILTYTGLFWHIYRALLTYTQCCLLKGSICIPCVLPLVSKEP